ncbi:transcriptional regulator GcvA [Parasedimentitalea marina]|uniref:Transcriptional regulator GcvA n=1 Tax=Parasedimentitalea marina TaxID=2483033 RepID=A0A3T0MYB5_9RHOB|nr:transcriptional regulator GcvA [Parasedimentitalea marina]AZV76755.1 transcriptional regulator GcvA [Parasedimentitalea marina]
MSLKNDRSPLPLRALQVFESASRFQNFTTAGGELGITQSAVSRKIAELEAILGTQLFRRSGPNLSLTPQGKALAMRVTYALGDLRRACAEVQPTKGSSIVTLSMLPSVAAKWLAPRLGLFTDLHPNIDLRISASRDLVDLNAAQIDGAIRYGTGRWPGLAAVWLGAETVCPVCASSIVEKFAITTPADLLKAPLLHADIAEDWAAWFSAVGLEEPKVPRGPKLGDDTAILQAALSGQGIALGRSQLVADDLQAGRLIAPFDVKLDASFSYWFVSASDPSKNLVTVRDWIVQEFA